MSDPNNESPARPELDDFVTRYLRESEEYRGQANRLDPANKDALFGVLAANGISHVVVTFDGYGDSGQIESIEAKAGDDSIDLPKASVTLVLAEMGKPDGTPETLSLEDALEAMAYDFLERTHAGWENNDGANGEFTFDVASRTVSLSYNERYSSSENYAHEF